MNRTLPITIGSKLLVASSDGSQYSASEDCAPAFSCAIPLFTPSAAPNDIAAISLGYYGRCMSVKRIEVSGISTSGGQLYIRLEKTGNGALGSYITPPISSHDQNDQSSTGLVWQFTTNRTGDQNTLGAGRRFVG